MNAAARKAILSARTGLVLNSPFFGSLALRLKLEEDPTCDTAWTDGATIGYNPDYVLSLSAPALAGLVAHEVLHVSSGHPWRRGGRDAKRWNVAADYAINDTLAAAGFELPAGALVCPAEFKGKGTEWIYDRLPAGQDDSDDKSGQGSGAGGQDTAPAAPGEVRDAPTDDGAPTEEDARQATAQAAAVAQARGQLPGELERYAKAAAAPSVDWRSVLARFAQAAARADYSWSRPNTRYLARGLYLPALRSVEMGGIAIIEDTSGSVDDVMNAQMGAEIAGIIDALSPAWVKVIYADSRVRRVDTFERGEGFEFRPCGGGGTDFRPAFVEIDSWEEPPACAVYLTDLYGSFPAQAPEYPVLWAATSRQVAPFGETVPVAG